MKREFLVPLILIVGLSMLVTPISAVVPPQDGEIVLPIEMKSDGYGKMRMGEKWGFWPIYCRGCATFNYYTYYQWLTTDVYLNIYGRCCDASAIWVSYWGLFDPMIPLDMKACGSIFTFELPEPLGTNGFEIGGARVVVFVMSGVPDPTDILDPLIGLYDLDACGIVVVYGCGYFYIGRIDYVVWSNEFVFG